MPCAYCTRIKLQCKYPSSRPSVDAAEDDDLAARVRSVERALQSLEKKITHIGNLLQVGQEPSNGRHQSTEHDCGTPVVSNHQKKIALALLLY